MDETNAKPVMPHVDAPEQPLVRCATLPLTVLHVEHEGDRVAGEEIVASLQPDAVAARLAAAVELED